jgi:nucleoside phosphorylase
MYMAGIGKASPAAVASSIRISFKGIKLGLLIGIYRGALKTNNETEVFLGDVIISETVIQIDFSQLYSNKFL